MCLLTYFKIFSAIERKNILDRGEGSYCKPLTTIYNIMSGNQDRVIFIENDNRAGSALIKIYVVVLHYFRNIIFREIIGLVFGSETIILLDNTIFPTADWFHSYILH